MRISASLVASTFEGRDDFNEGDLVQRWRTSAQLSSAADQVVAIPADATDPGAAPKVVATAEERLGPITLLINNAGQSRAVGPIRAVDPIAWWNEVEVNLRGPFLYAHAVLPSMLTRRSGRIINVASIAGLQAIPTMSAYVVGKTALLRFSENMALGFRARSFMFSGRYS